MPAPAPAPDPSTRGTPSESSDGLEHYKLLSRLLPDEREHAANVVRLGIALRYGTIIWLAFSLTDWLLSRTVYPRPFLPLLALRLAAAPLYLTFLWLLHRKPAPGPRAFVWFDTATFASAGICLGIFASLLGGIAGPYTPGVLLVLISRSAFVVQPWRRSVLPNALTVLTHFAALYATDYLRLGSWSAVFAFEPWALVALHVGSLATGAALLSLASNATWMLGRRVFAARNLGHYRLRERIAEGGHGEVWKAYHPGLRQEVAIKVLRSELAYDERALRRFEREIDTLCRLRHPHTIRILDYGVTADGVCYYAMELLEGKTLADLVRDEGPLPAARVVYLMLQASAALAEAHEHGMVHRDIKPENLFVWQAQSVSDFLKVIDFGIAKHEVSLAASVTRTGVVIGTPAFMAPEVAQGLPARAHADVYGIGAVAFFLLTGEPPGSVPSYPAGSDVPADVGHVISRCLTLDPSARYPDAQQLAAALAALHAHHPYRPTEGVPKPGYASASTPTRTG